jgi:uncharacterized protein YndB with AHSA1/START domain
MSASVALVVRRFVRAPAERVFAAWTEPELLRRWWGPRPVTCCDASVDLRVGGTYRIGNALPDGSVLWISGEFEVVEPPTRLVYTWLIEGKTHGEDRSLVTVRFETRDGGTEVIIVHERVDSEETRKDHERGWIGCLDGLDALFADETAAQKIPPT